MESTKEKNINKIILVQLLNSNNLIDEIIDIKNRIKKQLLHKNIKSDSIEHLDLILLTQTLSESKFTNIMFAEIILILT